MPYGFGAALTWALDTVILGIALANPAFAATPQAIALAAFTSTFLHDASSAVFTFAYMGIRRKLGETWRTLRSKSVTGGKIKWLDIQVPFAACAAVKAASSSLRVKSATVTSAPLASAPPLPESMVRHVSVR